ncbi:LOW QUALITY PROTEIN: dynein light chain Tctex-type 5 [Aulostomus maculatus]
MSDVFKDKSQRRDKKTAKASSNGSHGVRGKDGRTKDSLSTVSCIDELGHQDENTRMDLKTENTYQLPYKHFPVPAVTDILKDVLTSYLQEEKYEVEWSRQMTKTICEVIRARVKDLLIPRYKIVVLVHIGQLAGQSMQISSRCLWDATNDTFTSHSFTNSSLYGIATVYSVYFE